MSVSSAHRVVSQSRKSSYGTNWPAVWGAGGIVFLLIGVALARQLWPTAAPAGDQQIASAERAVRAEPKVDHGAALLAVRAPIELAAVDSTLDLVLAPQSAPRSDSTLHSKIAEQVPVAAAPTRPAAETAKFAPTIEPVEEGSFSAADALTPENLALDLQGHSLELDFLSLPGVVTTIPGVDRRGQKIKSVIRTDLVEVPDLAALHLELAGLPFRRGEECRKSTADTQELKRDSLRLHCVIDAMQFGNESRHMSNSAEQEFRAAFERRIVGEYRETPVASLLRNQPCFREPAAADTLVQMLQPMDESVRFELVGGLSAIDSPVASAALVQRAIYDLSPRVRDAALNELRRRPTQQYQKQFLAGLRYPWAPVADHAAQAIVALNLQEVVPDLNRMVDLPNPGKPHEDEAGRWITTDLVRVNHLRSCYLCHAPSTSASDVIRGSVPTPGERVRPVYSRDDHVGFIRADVTYLKQDFSVVQEMPEADPWPRFQRFDYLVRTREATLAEIALANSPEALDQRNQDYPQRVAVRHALDGLLEKATHPDSALPARVLR